MQNQKAYLATQSAPCLLRSELSVRLLETVQPRKASAKPILLLPKRLCFAPAGCEPLARGAATSVIFSRPRHMIAHLMIAFQLETPFSPGFGGCGILCLKNSSAFFLWFWRSRQRTARVCGFRIGSGMVAIKIQRQVFYNKHIDLNL